MRRRAYIVTGLGYGDEGKGRAVDYIARQSQADLTVFFNGGGQRGHNVVVPGEKNATGKRELVHHEFRQFGSASFVPGVRTHISGFCVVDPELLFREYEQLLEKTGEHMLGRLSIDSRCPIVTPFHRAANRVRESAERHGSCGMGIWETERDRREGGPTLELVDVIGVTKMNIVAKLRRIQSAKRDQVEDLVPLLKGGWSDALAQPFRYGTSELIDLAETYQIMADLATITAGMPTHDTVVFEGSQGLLLDENLGWHPHTTGSTTTSANARALLKWEGDYDADYEVTHIGVARAYSTRHGNGPFVAESPMVDFPEPHNGTGEWQGAWRQGFTDLVALRYAGEADEFDSVFLTHMDTLESVREWHVAHEYIWNAPEREDHRIPVPRNRRTQAIIAQDVAEAAPNLMQANPSMVPELVERATRRPVSLVSYGPTHADVDQTMPIGTAA